MPSMTKVICGNPSCKKEFEARTADVKRGWGKFCSKSCKAHKQTKDTGFCGPDYRAEGRSVHQMKSGHYAKSKLKRGKSGKAYRNNIHYEPWDDEVLDGSVFWSDRHGCWMTRDDGSDPLIDAHPFDSEAAGFNNT